MTKFRKEPSYMLTIEVAEEIYRITRNMSENERSLVDQGIRAIGSVVLNIAEGHGQIYTGKRINHFNDAYASVMEVMAFLDIAFKWGFITKEEYQLNDLKLQNISEMLKDLRDREIARAAEGEKYTELIGRK
ncbi:four helix bundle protein [Anoxybacillus ayderensis]|uniref:four helix bundle protein n=1 Tax=Anoxybacillus ayderensis TaxID=265546 RepID=UPI002E24D0C9|nr:four helix bundle protein [Anoxybacillus ayderensis]